jgi:hypothetical protein
VNLTELIAFYREDHHLPDPGPVEVVLATIAANLLPGTPCWLLVVGAPSSGKTNGLDLTLGLDYMHDLDATTLAGLGTARRSKNGRLLVGGLVFAQLGKFGILRVPDFGSILASHSDTQSPVLMAMRRLYDGHWQRTLDGQSVEWRGRVGQIACVTEVIDLHYEALGVLGERYVFYRMPTLSAADRLAIIEVAAQNYAAQNRQAQLSEAGATFFHELDLRPLSEEMPQPQGAEASRLFGLIDLACRARTPVQRDGYDRVVVLVPDPEAPGRMTKAILQFRAGLMAIGVEQDERVRLTEQVVLDSVPKTRRTVLDYLVQLPVHVLPSTAEIADEVGFPTTTATRILEDLAAHGVAQREHASNVLLWRASEGARRLLGSQSESERPNPRETVTPMRRGHIGDLANGAEGF